MASFDKPFANKGHKTPISMEDLGSEGAISWEQGFTSPYSKPPEAGGKYVLREEMNQILYLITKKQIDLEKGLNTPVLYDPAIAAKGYPIGARVYAYYNPYTCNITSDLSSAGEESIKYRLIHFINLKNNNTDSPLVLENLFKTWIIDDGEDIGNIKISIINPYNQAFGAPPGYLDLGESDTNSKRKRYKIEDYPRVKDILNSNKFPYIKKDSSDPNLFYIEDLRGCFPRLYSNNHSSRDPLRAFDNIQEDAGRRLEGEVMLMEYNKFNKDIKNQNQEADAMCNISCWYVPTVPGKKSCFQNVQHSTLLTNKESESATYGRGLYTSKIETDELKHVLGNRLRLDTTEVWGNSKEFRPHNFNVKMYLKL